MLDGKIYIFGPDGLFSFDPATGAWETDLPLPVSGSSFRFRLHRPAPTHRRPRAQEGGGVGSAQVAAHNGCVWVVGGVDSTRCCFFSPAAGTWTEAPPLPTPQSWGAAWSTEAGLLCIGGAHWHEEAETYHFDNRVFRLVE